MRILNKVREFVEEAPSAVYTKQQAVTVTMRLLEMEYKDPQNDAQEKAALGEAIKRAEFRYLDMTKTDTDALLDTLGVARFTTADIAKAIDDMIFDVR